jgi:hypothetical protein
MEEKNPKTTEKIILPKNLQREMIKFFARCNATKNVTDKDNQQTPEIPKKGVLIVDKHRHLCPGFYRGTSARRLFNPGARGKITKLCQT